MTSSPRTSKERKRVRASTGTSDDDSECDRLTSDARPCQAERKRELERNRRNLINIRFSELDAELHLSSNCVERNERLNGGASDARGNGNQSSNAGKGRRIDKEAVLKEASQRLAAQRKELSAATERIDAMMVEIDDLRAEKLELRGDKAYLRTELDTVREEVRRLRSDNIAFWQLAKKYWFSKNDLTPDLIKFPMELFAPSRDDNNNDNNNNNNNNNDSHPTASVGDDKGGVKHVNDSTDGKDALAARNQLDNDGESQRCPNVPSQQSQGNSRDNGGGHCGRVAEMSDQIPTLLQSPVGSDCGKSENLRSGRTNVGHLSHPAIDSPPLTQHGPSVSGSPASLSRSNVPTPAQQQPSLPYLNDFMHEDINDLFKNLLPTSGPVSTSAPTERKFTDSPHIFSSPQSLGLANGQVYAPVQSQSHSQSHSQSQSHSRCQVRGHEQATKRGQGQRQSQSRKREQAMTEEPSSTQPRLSGGMNNTDRWCMSSANAAATMTSSPVLSHHSILAGLDSNPRHVGEHQQHLSASLVGADHLSGPRSSASLSPSDAAHMAREVLSARAAIPRHLATAQSSAVAIDSDFIAEPQNDEKMGDDGFSDIAFCV